MKCSPCNEAFSRYLSMILRNVIFSLNFGRSHSMALGGHGATCKITRRRLGIIVYCSCGHWLLFPTAEWQKRQGNCSAHLFQANPSMPMLFPGKLIRDNFVRAYISASVLRVHEIIILFINVIDICSTRARQRKSRFSICFRVLYSHLC